VGAGINYNPQTRHFRGFWKSKMDEDGRTKHHNTTSIHPLVITLYSISIKNNMLSRFKLHRITPLKSTRLIQRLENRWSSHSSTSTSSTSTSPSNAYEALNDYTSSQTEKSILIVGDGDLSNGAAMSDGLMETRPDVKLIATVLESQQQHNDGTNVL